MRKTVIILLLTVAALAAGEYLAGPSALSAPDRADLFELLTLEDTPVFIPAPGGGVRTRPELVNLDNSPVSFSTAPAPGVTRIVCIGGSTTAGWPYHPRAGYPERLKLYLKDFSGGASGIEVINAGFHNFDSRRETDVAAQMARYKPDIAVIYSGYNELQTYYARGAAGALRAPHRFLVKHSALYNRLRRSVGLSGNRGNASVYLPRLSKNQKEKLFLRFRRNLETSVKELKAGGASVFLLELAWAPGYTPPFPDLEYINRMNGEIRRVAAQSGAAVIRTGEYIGVEDFVDAEHLTITGYGKLGLAVADVLCGGPLAAQGCRRRHARGEADYIRILKADDRNWLAGVHSRLALVYCVLQLEEKAVAQLKLAESCRPGAAREQLAGTRNKRILELLALVTNKSSRR